MADAGILGGAGDLSIVCRCGGCHEAASVEIPFCRSHWRALPRDLRAGIARQYRIGYGTGLLPATWQTAVAVEAGRLALQGTS